jgi:hypothetical protein
MNKLIVDKKSIQKEYGFAISDYDKFIIDNYMKAINETEKNEAYVRNIIYTFLALKKSYKN